MPSRMFAFLEILMNNGSVHMFYRMLTVQTLPKTLDLVNKINKNMLCLAYMQNILVQQSIFLALTNFIAF